MGKKTLSYLRKRKKSKTSCNQLDQAHNLKKSRPLIDEWHRLEKELAQAKTPEEAAQTNVKMEEFGGLQRYQDASITYQVKSVSKFNAAKWVTSCLKKRDRPIRLLDVGALTNHFLPFSSWIDCTAIDLNPRHPSVLKYDFFDYHPGDVRFDVVVLSLVLNYVPCKTKRALMIKQSAELLADLNSALFIILPKACTENSRYLNQTTFVNGLKKFGLEPVDSHCKSSTKLSFWMLRKCAPDESVCMPNKILRSGDGHNNFRIDFSGV